MDKDLKTLREEKGLTLEDVAKYIGCSKQGYWYYEKGKRKIPLETAIKLSKLYNIKVEDIFFYTKSNRNVNIVI